MIEYTKRNIKTWARLGSCGTFGIAMLEIAKDNKEVVALTADLLYYSGLERFSHTYPERFYNIGIAEQNMVGIAAGMAKEGMVPFATTYATFASTRAADQVRVNMGYMQLGIKLIGLTAGLSVGILGATHMSFEDLAIMRSIPNITILSPADCTETVKMTQLAMKHDGPVYLRLTGVMNHPIVYQEDYQLEIGKAIKLKDGKDIAIIATGSMVYEAIKVAKILEEQGLEASVFDVHTIKPLDIEMIKKLYNQKLIVTVEEHSIIGGLGSAVSEVLATAKDSPPQLTIGVEQGYPHAGEYHYLLDRCGLVAEKIVKKIIKKYEEVK